MGPFLGFKNKLLILIFDFFTILGVSLLVYYTRLNQWPGDFAVLWAMGFFSICLLCMLYVFGTYDLDQGHTKWTLAQRLFLAIGFGVLFILIINYVFSIAPSGFFGRGIFFGSASLFFLVAFLSKTLISAYYNRGQAKLKWLVLIEDPLLGYFQSDLKRLGFDNQVEFIPLSSLSKSVLKDQLSKSWSAIIVGVSSCKLSTDLIQQLMEAKFSGCRVMDLSQFYEAHWQKVPIYFLEPEWFITSQGFQNISKPLLIHAKRLFDIVATVSIFLLTWPIMLLTGLVIKLESPGPIFYKQVRTGKNRKDFEIIKFRSMRVDAEAGGAQWAQKNDPRITRVGKFLRKTRIDELPQLWNVIVGDMSFVGPRPERPEFNDQLAENIRFYHLRHTMRPGLTGWAQVMYPYGASIDDAREKLQYELYYAKHFNLLMDVYILLKTVRVVLFGQGR